MRKWCVVVKVNGTYYTPNHPDQLRGMVPERVHLFGRVPIEMMAVLDPLMARTGINPERIKE